LVSCDKVTVHVEALLKMSGQKAEGHLEGAGRVGFDMAGWNRVRHGNVTTKPIDRPAGSVSQKDDGAIPSVFDVPTTPSIIHNSQVPPLKAVERPHL
jgi:hypothetical protein